MCHWPTGCGGRWWLRSRGCQLGWTLVTVVNIFALVLANPFGLVAWFAHLLIGHPLASFLGVLVTLLWGLGGGLKGWPCSLWVIGRPRSLVLRVVGGPGCLVLRVVRGPGCMLLLVTWVLGHFGIDGPKKLHSVQGLAPYLVR